MPPSRIQDLPVEMLILILEMASDCDEDLPFKFTYYRSLLRLRLVCKFWAGLISSTPALYRSLSATQSRKQRELVLTKSKSLSLWIYVPLCRLELSPYGLQQQREADEDILNFVKTIPRRFQIIHLEMDHIRWSLAFSLLKEQPSSFRALDHLSLHGRGRAVAISDFFQLLSSCSSLRIFELRETRLSGEESLEASLFTQLSTLHRLTLDVVDGSARSRLLELVDTTSCQVTCVIPINIGGSNFAAGAAQIEGHVGDTPNDNRLEFTEHHTLLYGGQEFRIASGGGYLRWHYLALAVGYFKESLRRQVTVLGIATLNGVSEAREIKSFLRTISPHFTSVTKLSTSGYVNYALLEKQTRGWLFPSVDTIEMKGDDFTDVIALAKARNLAVSTGKAVGLSPIKTLVARRCFRTESLVADLQPFEAVQWI